MEKRGQATLFIILGIIIVAVIALVIFARITGVSIPFLEKTAGEEMEIVKEEINDCLTEIGGKYIVQIGLQGGYLNVPEGSYRRYSDSAVSYLCYNIPGDRRCANRLLTQNHMQVELEDAIEQELATCVNVFEISDDITAPEPFEVSVHIGRETVDIELFYPVRIDKGEGDVVSEDMFSVSLNYPLGELYEVAMDIVDSEATTGDFDQLLYMLDHKSRYEIVKDRPYPDKVYKLRIWNGDYLFQFAVQGERG